MMMKTVRTISGLAALLKEKDPDCALTTHALRRLVVSGKIPSVTVGNRYLVALEDVQAYFDGAAAACTAVPPPGVSGSVRPLPVRVSDIDPARL